MQYTESELDIAARTVWGEARGEDYASRLAVAHVILNRWRARRFRNDHTLAATCLRRWQFSCWNEGDPNRAQILALRPDDPVLIECRDAVMDAMDANSDPTFGSTHYHTTVMGFPNAWGTRRDPAVIIGAHSFYNDVD